MARAKSGDRFVGETNAAIEQALQESIAIGSGVDEQTLADSDQTLADVDQTMSDSDQTSADRDQSAADRDQTAADRDQAASDRDLAFGGPVRVRTSSVVKCARARPVSAGGAPTPRTRVILRCATATPQPLSRRWGGSVTGAEIVIRAAGQRKRAARYRVQAAQQRELAAEDRQSAAHDREQAARERVGALTDRDALAGQLALVENDAMTGARTLAAGLTDLDHELDRCRETSGRLTVAYVDVVALQSLSDTQGRA